AHCFSAFSSSAMRLHAFRDNCHIGDFVDDELVGVHAHVPKVMVPAHEYTLERQIYNASPFRSASKRSDGGIVQIERYLQPRLAFVLAIKTVEFLPFKSVSVRGPNADILTVVL